MHAEAKASESSNAGCVGKDVREQCNGSRKIAFGRDARMAAEGDDNAILANKVIARARA